MTPEDFDTRWSRLPSPASVDRLEADEVAPGSGLWVARDHANTRVLLVETLPGATCDVPGTHGLTASVAIHQVQGKSPATFIVLRCMAAELGETFAAVAAEAVVATADEDLADRPRTVERVIREWRWFWDADRSRLSSAEAVGLLAELWFMVRWAGVSPDTVQAWGGSEGARHDFQWAARSVEVKATARAGPVVHTIQNLEQLADPEVGRLYLFSLRLTRDALATNSVHRLVENVVDGLADQPEVRSDFLAKLASRGFSPAVRDEAAVAYRVVDEALYEVVDGFPRLSATSFEGGLPQAITGVSYQVDMTACEQWRMGRGASAWPPA